MKTTRIVTLAELNDVAPMPPKPARPAAMRDGTDPLQFSLIALDASDAFIRRMWQELPEAVKANPEFYDAVRTRLICNKSILEQEIVAPEVDTIEFEMCGICHTEPCACV